MVYTQGKLQKADVLIGNGKVQIIAQTICAPGAEVFPAEGLIVSPGFVDVHVHLREPGFSQSEAMMLAAMERIKSINGLLAAHCEDESLIDKGGCVHKGAAANQFGVPGISSESEWHQIERDIELVRKSGVRYHVCHISAKESVELIRGAKRQGLPVTCECTPHQIMLCNDDIVEDHGRFKMNPPLRSLKDREAIVEGLCDGTIDCIATDHAPHTLEEKGRGLQGSAFGVVGLETAFAVCYTALVKTGRMTMEQLLDKLTCAPARLINREQELKVGATADIVVLDINEVWRVDPERFASMGRATPFEGLELPARVVATFRQGRQIFHKSGFGKVE